MFYLTAHSNYCIYGYLASDIGKMERKPASGTTWAISD